MTSKSSNRSNNGPTTPAGGPLGPELDADPPRQTKTGVDGYRSCPVHSGSQREPSATLLPLDRPAIDGMPPEIGEGGRQLVERRCRDRRLSENKMGECRPLDHCAERVSSQ